MTVPVELCRTYTIRYEHETVKLKDDNRDKEKILAPAGIMPEMYDHNHRPVQHGRARVNGIRMHYTTAGTGPALLLIHGTPKTHFYWYKITPLLTPYFTIVAPDLRGFGDSDKPPAAEGYDVSTNAKDVAELMSQLGHSRFHVHGEDRGAEFAYAVAAIYRDRVISLSFCEMLLSGHGLTEMSHFTQQNISAQYEERGVWNWHIPFFWIPHVPEMLIQGKEQEFWTHFMKLECYNPDALEQHAIDEWVRCSKSPGGLRGILETYRSHWVNADIEQELSRTKLTCPVMTVGAPEFFGPLVEGQMRKLVIGGGGPFGRGTEGVYVAVLSTALPTIARMTVR